MSSFKVFLPNNEIRRFRLQDNNYTSLEQYLCSLLNINSSTSSQTFRSIYNLTYIDDEDEHISLSNTEELLDAINLANGTHVKIYLRRNNNQNDSQQHNDFPPLYHDDEEQRSSSSSSSSSSSLYPNLYQQQQQQQQNEQQNEQQEQNLPPPPPFNTNYVPSFSFQASFQNFSPDQLPPQLSFLSEYLHFNPPHTTPSNPQTPEQHQEYLHQRHQRQQALVSEIQELIFSMIILSARMSSYLIGNRISLNEERVRQQYDLYLSRGLSTFINVFARIVRRLRNVVSNRRPSIRKIFRFMLALYFAKIILLPCAIGILGIASYFVGLFWAATWTILPFLLLFPLISVFFRVLTSL